MSKYKTITVSKIITQIAKEIHSGYSEGIIEIFFPDDNEMKNWSDEKVDLWILENNTRMQAICDFLNKENL